jgi:hypothetical protein
MECPFFFLGTILEFRVIFVVEHMGGWNASTASATEHTACRRRKASAKQAFDPLPYNLLF